MKRESDYCNVIAIIRCELLDKVEKKLQELNVHGFSVTQVKGCGEYLDHFSHECLKIHARIEIFTFTRRAETIARAIMETAHTGEEGDGIVAILPVSWVYRIRTHQLLTQRRIPRDQQLDEKAISQ